LGQQHLLKREHPPCTERISLTKEGGWKDGDRGGLAEWELIHGKKKCKCALTSTGLLMEGLSPEAVSLHRRAILPPVQNLYLK
jgi:hypothetical protein